jgi:hypothetical protein
MELFALGFAIFAAIVALLALSVVRASKWRSIETAPTYRAILVHYKNEQGLHRIVKAIYIPRFSVESHPESDVGIEEYDEENDRFTYLEGWYEVIDNWDEYGFIRFEPGHEPDAWQYMPEIPNEQ